MNKRDLAIKYRNIVGHLPNTAELALYIQMGEAKSQCDFSTEELEDYVPKENELRNACQTLGLIAWAWESRSALFKKVEKARELEERAQRRIELDIERARKQWKRTMLKSTGPIPNRKHASLADNRRRVDSVIDYHIRHPEAILTEEMLVLLNKYK